MGEHERDIRLHRHDAVPGTEGEPHLRPVLADEWTRIREVETERFLMDCHGMFYELSPAIFVDSVWGVRSISTHLRVIPDYCSFRGMFVIGGNETTANGDVNPIVGQPQSGMWFVHKVATAVRIPFEVR